MKHLGTAMYMFFGQTPADIPQKKKTCRKKTCRKKSRTYFAIQ